MQRQHQPNTAQRKKLGQAAVDQRTEIMSMQDARPFGKNNFNELKDGPERKSLPLMPLNQGDTRLSKLGRKRRLTIGVFISRHNHLKPLVLIQRLGERINRSFQSSQA